MNVMAALKITVSGEGYADFSLPVERRSKSALFDGNSIGTG